MAYLSSIASSLPCSIVFLLCQLAGLVVVVHVAGRAQLVSLFTNISQSESLRRSYSLDKKKKKKRICNDKEDANLISVFCTWLEKFVASRALQDFRR